MIGLWAYSDDKTVPPDLSAHRIITWTWQGIADFIDSL